MALWITGQEPPWGLVGVTPDRGFAGRPESMQATNLPMENPCKPTGADAPVDAPQGVSVAPAKPESRSQLVARLTAPTQRKPLLLVSPLVARLIAEWHDSGLLVSRKDDDE